MALDGIVISNIINELNTLILGGRIDKIYQPNSDEIIINLRNGGNNYRLLLSANAGSPRVHITNSKKENPPAPPTFCMVARKYFSGGKITKISQDGFERIISIEVEALNELGDISSIFIIVEIMGKHSNIIFTDENKKIIDSIKRVPNSKSSVREVLPGREYTAPPNQGKFNPLSLEQSSFNELIYNKRGLSIQEFIYKSYSGISPFIATEICHRASIEASSHVEELKAGELQNVFESFISVMDIAACKKYTPEIVCHQKTGRPVEFSSIEICHLHGFDKKLFESVSQLLENFYEQRDISYHISQKAHDLKKLVSNNIERCVKKKEIQIKTLKDTQDMDIWKLKGELLTANIYSVKKGMTVFKTQNFYSENLEEIEISLDPTKSPAQNAQRYFDKYNKAKRTKEALKIQAVQNNEELEYLLSVQNSIENSNTSSDLAEIRQELVQEGFIKKRSVKNKSQKKSKPYVYLSSDNIEIYAGKSNIQNDELTFKFADSNDIWLHTKNIPGSHIIIKSMDLKAVPDNTLLEALNIAVYHSKAKNSSNVSVDYTKRKNVKKPKGAKPGFVIYEKYKTAFITVNEKLIDSLKTDTDNYN